MQNGGYWRKALNFEARPRFFPLLSNSCVGKAFLNSWPIYLWFLRVFFSNSKFENGICLVLSESVFLATWREWLTQCSSILIFPRHLVVCSTELSSYRFSLSLSLSPSLPLSSFRAATSAYGSSQAKGWIIGAADAGPCHRHSKTMLDLSHICDLHHSLGQHWILNPLREARDWTQVFVDTSQVRNFWATMRTATLLSFILFGNYSVYSTLTLAEKMRW